MKTDKKEEKKNFLINNLSRWKTIITGMSTLKKKKIKTLIK